MDNNPPIHDQFVFYASGEENSQIRITVLDENLWASQAQIAELFGTSKQSISRNLKNIFFEGELEENTCVKEILTHVDDLLKYNVSYYNLDAIIAVGYRINSYKATRFRIWATQVLKEYMIKGFALDDERLKQGNTVLGKSYFDELLERTREIRASERMFYQKITDIFSQTSIDYDKNSPIAREFSL